jgi:predicted molibdopterin-dependent oxidoreductase YjgC
VIAARQAGAIRTLIVHGVLMTDLARAADVVLPGAAWVEKDGAYVNGQGLLQGAARVIPPPGEALDNWQVLLQVGTALGASVTFTDGAQIRSQLGAALSANPTYTELAGLTFARPVAAQHWLQASNPSERWKWDFMFQDLPPVKFAGTPRATSAQHLAIPLQKVD